MILLSQLSKGLVLDGTEAMLPDNLHLCTCGSGKLQMLEEPGNQLHLQTL